MSPIEDGGPGEAHGDPQQGRSDLEVVQTEKATTNRKKITAKWYKDAEEFIKVSLQTKAHTGHRGNRRRKKVRGGKVAMTINPWIGDTPVRQRQLEQLRVTAAERSAANMASLDYSSERHRDHLRWWGDELEFDEQWPTSTSNNTIRLFTINLNGISHYNDYLEWDLTLGFLHDMQVDVFGLTEPNLDFLQPQVRDAIMEHSKRYDKYTKYSFSTSKQSVEKTPFKMGGTITGVHGGWSGRMTKSKVDKMD